MCYEVKKGGRLYFHHGFRVSMHRITSYHIFLEHLAHKEHFHNKWSLSNGSVLQPGHYCWPRWPTDPNSDPGSIKLRCVNCCIRSQSSKQWVWLKIDLKQQYTHLCCFVTWNLINKSGCGSSKNLRRLHNFSYIFLVGNMQKVARCR